MSEGQWIAKSECECVSCHRQFEVQYRRVIAGWFWRLRYCPFCGKRLIAPTNGDDYESATGATS